MNRISKHIAQKLIDKLPGDEQYYALDDLRECGFPGFVVQRIQVELERNLAESIVPPRTDWANMNSDAVEDAWQHFIDAIRKEARLPASYARSIIETAIEDIVCLLIQPRENLPDIIFGASEKLSYEEVLKQMDAIVVYQHFGSLIPRYMKRKDLQSLEKERCADIIARADKKLTSKYTPLNWAQMLDPLFKLLDNQIDSNLLRLFFEDKKMPEIARRFDIMNSSLNRAELIEMLSSPELLDMEKPEADIDLTTGTENLRRNKKDPADASEGLEVAVEENDLNKKEVPDAVGGNHHASTAEENKKKEDSIISNFDQESEPPGPETEQETPGEEESFSLNTIFSRDDDEEETEKRLKVENSERNLSLNDIFSEEPEDKAGGYSIEKQEIQVAEQYREEEKRTERKDWVDVDYKTEEKELRENEEIEINEIPEDERGERETTPMWQRFMSHEEKQEMEFRKIEDQEAGKEKPEEPEEEPDEDGFVEEPVIDLTEDNEADQTQSGQLRKLLIDEQDRFIEEIFSGSEEAFDEAVEEIAAKDNWRSASRYIEKEIYKRNLVDMYSETAVDFTDRLQSYFMKKKSN